MNAPAVRRLTAPDAAALRQLRLNALVETPESFGSSYEEEHTLTLADIRAWISPADDGAMYGVFLGDTLAGIVGVSRQRKLKLRHKAHIWSMYVAPAHRGQGLGRLLMRAAIDHAATMRGVRQVQLSVTANNTAASALYASLGFTVYGHEPEALCVNGQLYDETLMAMPLSDG
ncbi:GNAT family N-acetyltransferase [Achromobacter mucicolens]|jgi:ribosomal protein S18 acetylase RimI-like enzyme|uniref:GNAT family N-acetyltransferase n=1 Tax=Achromobacter TaxID=222 RepID=UPI0006F42438|nr:MULTISPECIES: GNAT family N-acetyltransferase [Achromobacter]KRB10564.1 GNAT family acetyltransferase [Achromobacter sp. Root170]MDF2861938.1 N-acetyltransferase [Achromobacter mucicolens]